MVLFQNNYRDVEFSENKPDTAKSETQRNSTADLGPLKYVNAETPSRPGIFEVEYEITLIHSDEIIV